MDNNVASKLPVAAMSAGAVLTQRADLAKGSLSLLKIHLDMLAPFFTAAERAVVDKSFSNISSVVCRKAPSEKSTDLFQELSTEILERILLCLNPRELLDAVRDEHFYSVFLGSAKLQDVLALTVKDIHLPGFQSDYFTPFAHGVFDWISVSHESPYGDLLDSKVMHTYVTVFSDKMISFFAITSQKEYLRQMLLCNPPIYVLRLGQLKCPCSSDIWTAQGQHGGIFAPDGITLWHLVDYIKRFRDADRFVCPTCSISMKTRVPRLMLVARHHAVKADDPVIEEGASKELRANLLAKD